MKNKTLPINTIHIDVLECTNQMVYIERVHVQNVLLGVTLSHNAHRNILIEKTWYTYTSYT